MDKSFGALRHIRNYASGGLFSALIGVATFPILTRSLSVEDYGILGLILSTLTLFVAVGKFGIQHSIMRFYAEIKNQNSPFNESQFYSTTLILAFGLGIATMVVWLIAGYWFAPAVAGTDTITQYFLVGTLYIFFRMLSSNMSNVLSAQLKSNVVMLSVVVRRVSYLLVILAYVFTDAVSVAMVVIAFVVAEFVCLVYIARYYLPTNSHFLRDANLRLSSTLLLFGLPLMLLESLGLVMRLSDRYVIQYLLDENALGQYAASYNLVGYLEIIVLAAMLSTIKPIYAEIWESRGKESTQEFLSQGLHVYVMVGIPFVAVFSLVAPHAMNVLASSKYEPGTVIIPWVTLAILVEGALCFLAAGIYLRKETGKLVFWSGLAVTLNIVLNFIFIPTYGILGASVITLISFTFYTLGITSSAFRLLKFDTHTAGPLKIAVISLFVWFALRWLPLESDVLAVLLKGTLATVILFVVLILLDQRVRQLVYAQINRIAPGLIEQWGNRVPGMWK